MKFTGILGYLAIGITIIIIGRLSYNVPVWNCCNKDSPNLRSSSDSQLKEHTRCVNISERTSALHEKHEDIIHTDNDALAQPNESVLKSKVDGNYKLTRASEINYGSNHDINWTVIVTVNNGYWDFFLNWFRSYRNMNIKCPIVAIAEDNLVYMKLKTFYSDIIHIEKSEFTAATQAVNYGSNAFSQLVSQRPTHILKYITRGIDVLYADIDAVWLQIPFPYFNGDFDMWMQLDSVVHNVPKYCTGLMAIRSNDATVHLLRKWEQSLHDHVEIDQDAFNRIIVKSPVRLSTLNTKEFPSGKQYFVEYTDVQRSNVVVVHNNWIVGHDKKQKRFQNMSLWFVHNDSESVLV